MNKRASRLTSALVAVLVPALGAPLASRAEAAPETACPQFSVEQGGYRISTAFAVDPLRVAPDYARPDRIITPPKCLHSGDLLSIRPLRLNPDEYLVLQKCERSGCEVVRAWNSGGYMGPYPVLTNKIPVEAGASYVLWMQHVPMPGTRSFHLIDRSSPPLVFRPIGRLTAYPDAQRALQAARKRGPERITRTVRQRTSFVATFQGGSVVRMQALRPGR